MNDENNLNEQTENEEKQVNIPTKLFIIIPMVLFCFLIIYIIVAHSCLFSHNWIDATCEKAKTCVRCKETEGSPLGHEWVDATCEKAKTCSRCGKTDGEPLGHNVQEWKVEKEATCTEGGSRTGLCITCNKNVTEVIPASGHTLGKWEIGTEATIDLSGEKIQKCTKCGEIINKDIYYLTEEEKAELIRQEQEAKEAAEKAEREAKKAAEEAAEKAENERKASMFAVTVLSAERSSDDYVRINYRIKNNSGSDQSWITVRGTLYKSNGEAVTSSNSYVMDLPANQSKEDTVLIRYSGYDYSTYDVKVIEIG